MNVLIGQPTQTEKCINLINSQEKAVIKNKDNTFDDLPFLKKQNKLDDQIHKLHIDEDTHLFPGTEMMVNVVVSRLTKKKESMTIISTKSSRSVNEKDIHAAYGIGEVIMGKSSIAISNLGIRTHH